MTRPTQPHAGRARPSPLRLPPRSLTQAAEDFGAVRCAELLSRLTGLPVHPAHIEDLAGRGLLQPSRTYRQRPLYRVADLHALATGPLTRALITEITGTDSQLSP